jgi:hypothetical protein
LRLESPAWTTAGEILNLDRFAMHGGQELRSPKYVLPHHGAIYTSAMQFLDQVSVENGFCYKDVTQPFVMSSWLSRGPLRPVLKIRPNIAHTAFAMLQRKWMYPTIASRGSGGWPAMMVEGLLAAETVMRAVPGEEVGFDELLESFAPLDRALARLYPGERVAPLAPLPDFERRRDEVLARRQLDNFKALSAIEREMREKVAA